MSQPEAQSAQSKGFPWLYVFRWIVGFALAAHGLLALYWLLSSWAYLTDQAIILPALSPSRFLPMLLLKTATGVAILLRSRFAIVLALAWCGAFVVMYVDKTPVAALPGQFWFALAELFAVVVFLLLLWSRRLLR